MNNFLSWVLVPTCQLAIAAKPQLTCCFLFNRIFVHKMRSRGAQQLHLFAIAT
jgi:hypothetical protein